MAKKLLAFLGTGYYHTTIYYLKNNDQVNQAKPYRFIQCALKELLCKDWNEKDSIVVFITKGSEKKNWKTPNDNQKSITRSEGKYKDTATYEGLEAELNKISPPIPVNKIDVDEGKNEDELWKIFEKIVHEIQDGDEIYFDITHGFRSLPMLALMVLNYIRVLHSNVKIGGIYYGAYESIQIPPEFPQELKSISLMEIERRLAPIFDLTSFETLMRWTAGVDRFINTGDASILKCINMEMARKNPDKDKRNIAKNWKNLSDRLDDFSKTISTCRGTKISESTKELRKILNPLIDNPESTLLPATPMIPLLQKIREKTERFSDEANKDLENGLEAVNWCLEHNLIQQAYTILLETIISFVCFKAGYDTINIAVRDICSSYLSVVAQKTPEDEWKEILRSEDAKEVIDKIKEIDKFESLYKIYNNLGDFRNDINHAGYRKTPLSPNVLIKKIKELYEKIKDIMSS